MNVLPAKTERKPKTTRSAKPALSPSRVAEHLGERGWVENGALRLHDGVFLHALACARGGDADGVKAFAALSPKDWWVPLLGGDEAAAKELLAGAFVADGLRLHQLVGVALTFPKLASKANARLVEGLLAHGDAGHELRHAEAPFLHLVRADLSRAVAALPLLSSNSVDVPGAEFAAKRMAGALVKALAGAAHRALPRAVELWGDTPDLECAMSADAWKRVAPLLVGERFATVEAVLDQVAIAVPSLRVGPATTRHLLALWETRDLEGLRSALASSEKLRAENLPLAVASGALTVEAFLAAVEQQQKKLGSTYGAWQTLHRAAQHLRQLDRRSLQLIAARQAIAAKGPSTGATRQHDTSNWYEVEPSELLSQAQESDGEARLTLATRAIDAILGLPLDLRQRLAAVVVDDLVRLNTPELALRLLKKSKHESSPSYQTACRKLVRALLGRALHAEAFTAFEALWPDAAAQTGREVSRELVEALLPRLS